LIIVGLAEYLEKAKLLIQTLEGDVVRPESEIYVYFLENAKAEEMAKVLTGQAAQLMRDKQGGGGAPPPPNSPQGQKTNITITPDKPTNALVITASAEDYKVLKTIIEKLDIMRSQVLVEALIAEVALEKSDQLGIEWRFWHRDAIVGGVTPVGGTNFGNIIGKTQGNIATGANVLPSEGLLIGGFKGMINIGGKDIPNIPAVINALQKDKDTDIISTPHILTMDNEEAEIKVGEQRAFVTRTQNDATNINSTIRTFEYKDIGVTLKITPHISKDKYVRLEISQEIKDFVPESSTADAITTTNKSAKTTVTVANGEMVVIGGLISKSIKKNVSKVPCLGSIPIIGWFFKYVEEKKEKKNLLLFITPHIITSPDKLEQLTAKKKKEMDDEVNSERGKIKIIEDIKILGK
jgi:general secretion pathway protein D